MMMIKMYGNLYPIHAVKYIEFYMKEGRYHKYFTARIYWQIDIMGTEWSQLMGQSALDLVMRLDPNVLEGNPDFKFPKYAWAFHNLIAHPLMQILSFLGFVKLGLRIHDSTIPKPKLSYQK